MAQSGTSAPSSDELQRLQRRRKRGLRVLALFCVILLLVMDSSWRTSAPNVLVLLQRVGFLLILTCVLGRTWCTLYIGGHKKRELVMAGPYSIVRNPLYVFTAIGAAGVGLLAGSMILALLFTVFAVTVFSLVVRAEEAFLAGAFGRAFEDYRARVPRFWPRLSAWKDAEEVTVRPPLVARTFFEASLFLLAVPLIEVKTLAQASGWLPALIRLM